MNILDRRFKYVPAASTDVGKTIRREQKRLREAAEARKATVRELPKRAKGA